MNKSDKVGFRDYFGTATMGLTDGMAAALMTSFFMMYLTDYSGLGKFGAIIGSTVLLFSRFFDAVNDPIEGWIMDRAKVGKYGKYKPFIVLSILTALIGVTALFFIPADIAPWAAVIWVIVFYLLYDMGSSFYAPNLVFRSITLDQNERGKLLVAPRIISMMTGMVTVALIAMVSGVNNIVGSMHTAWGFTVGGLLLITSAVSIFGISLVRERHHPKRDADERIKITDFFRLLKENRPLRVNTLAALFSGFIWTFLFATLLYYIKWGLCADLTTGVVDNGKFAMYSAIAGALQFVPLVGGTFIAVPIMKKIGDPMKFLRILLLVQAIPCGVLFLLQILGVLTTMPWLFLVCAAITTTAVGMGYIPGSTVDIEIMDYDIYKNGKERSGLCNSMNRFIAKTQTAIGASVLPMILVAIGYVVDPVTGDYAGELSKMPVMLNWFIVIMGLIPFVLGIIAFLIERRYPITNDMRAEMRESLHKAEENE